MMRRGLMIVSRWSVVGGRWSSVTALAAVALLVAQAQPRSSGWLDRTRYVLTEREAFLFSAPEPVAPPTVTGVAWSSDGRHVLAAREEQPLTLESEPAFPRSTVSLHLWSRSSHRSKEVWRQPAGVGKIETIAWLPGTQTALAIAGWIEGVRRDAQGELTPPTAIRQVLLRLDAARGQVTAIANVGAGEQLHVSPVQPWAVLYTRDEEHGRGIRIVRATGPVGTPVPLSKSYAMLQWSRVGDLIFVHHEVLDAPGQFPVEKQYTYDMATRSVRPVTTPVDFALPPVERLPIVLKPSLASITESGTRATVRPLWLESVEKTEQRRALLCGDSDGGQLAPDGSSALYLSQGAAWVMPFLRMPKQSFQTARREALKAVAMSRGKQVAMAMLMYSQDYDEVLPPPENVNDRLLPYMRQREILNSPETEAPGFVYLLNVTRMSSIEKPAETVMGYLSGPGGRAVIYVDGHVKWEDATAEKRK